MTTSTAAGAEAEGLGVCGAGVFDDGVFGGGELLAAEGLLDMEDG